MQRCFYYAAAQKKGTHMILNTSLRLGMATLFSVLVVLALAACGGEATTDSNSTKQLRVAVIPKGTTHIFWQSVHAGARKAERELNAQGVSVAVTWKGPLKEDDRVSQIEVVQSFAAQGADAMVLAPLDKVSLVAPVEDAVKRGVTTVIIDSALESESYTSFVATDNYQGGYLAGQRLAELLGGHGSATGKVMMLRYMVNSASTEKREAGFLAAIQENPGISVVSDNQYAGATQQEAQEASQALLAKFGQEVQGVFCPNESSTAGMLVAMRDSKLLENVHLVGFDASPFLVEALQAGSIKGLAVQDPFAMGYKGVMNAVAAVQGKEVAKNDPTAVALVTPENMAEHQQVLNPPLAEYLP